MLLAGQEELDACVDNIKNALANGYDVVEYDSSLWRSFLQRESDGSTHDYKILEIQIND